jgi:hypothetical protein
VLGTIAQFKQLLLPGQLVYVMNMIFYFDCIVQIMIEQLLAGKQRVRLTVCV